MNYIAEIKAFYDRLETNPLPPPAIVLWHALMYIANKTGWQQEFAVALSVLQIKTGLNAKAVERARNTLAQSGLMIWKSRKGNQSAVYEMVTLCDKNTYEIVVQTVAQSVAQPVVQTVAQSVAINKHKHKQNINNNPPTPLRGASSESKSEGVASQDSGTRKPDNPSTTLTDRFDKFWVEYPKKKNKGDAEKAWKVIKPTEALLFAMLEKLKVLKISRQWTKEGGQYIPYPATWLRAKGWEDEVGESDAIRDSSNCGKPNRFVNFPQRNWDYSQIEALERKQLTESLNVNKNTNNI